MSGGDWRAGAPICPPTASRRAAIAAWVKTENRLLAKAIPGPKAFDDVQSRGVHLGTTKSGRERVVAMSRRLRSALLAFQLEQGRPTKGPIAPLDHANYRNRHFRALCRKVGVTLAVKADGTTRLHTPKDLRDTFASQLLTTGIQLGYVSRQLGHSDVSVTARHYARWAEGDAYRKPLEVREDEVPADLLSRLKQNPPQFPHSAARG